MNVIEVVIVIFNKSFLSSLIQDQYNKYGLID